MSDYGLLEEFVFMVTEIVPQLLSTRQRAELVLGLRARVSWQNLGATWRSSMFLVHVMLAFPVFCHLFV